MRKLSKIIPRKKDSIIAVCTTLGLMTAVISVFKNDHLMTAVGVFTAFLPYMIIERMESKEIKNEFTNALNNTNNRLDRVDSFLRANEPDVVNIAIFDHLLIYLPVYLAKERGYFEEEGISITFSPKLGDLPVAEAVWASTAQIGLCDPCMCARAEFANGPNQLYLLAPLVTKSAVKAVTKDRVAVERKLAHGGPLKIATYPAPSTTYVIAVDLKKRMLELHQNRGHSLLNIEVVTVPPERFSVENMQSLLDQHDLVMLWDPLLKVATEKAEVSSYDVNPGHMQQGEFMHSAVIISQKLLDRNPTIGLRIFRAISRATYHLHLAVRTGDEDLMAGVLNAAGSEKTVPLEPGLLSSLVADMVTGGLFPLISTPRQLHDGPKWREQFHKAIEYRRRAIATEKDKFSGEDLLPRTPELCRRHFCPKTAFAHSNAVNHNPG